LTFSETFIYLCAYKLLKKKNFTLFKRKQQVKTINTYSANMPAMPKGGAGNGYAPADYSVETGMLTLFES